MLACEGQRICSLSSIALEWGKIPHPWGNEWGRAEVRGPRRGGLTCPSLRARPFNPELHPSVGTWQWQGITKISGDCWVVWHLSLVMKYRESSCPHSRFPNSESFEEHFPYFLSWSWSSAPPIQALPSMLWGDHRVMGLWGWIIKELTSLWKIDCIRS